MAFEDLKAELALLINQMENQPEDPHELYLQIREKLNEMRVFGMPLPADLVGSRRSSKPSSPRPSARPRKTSRQTPLGQPAGWASSSSICS